MEVYRFGMAHIGLKVLNSLVHKAKEGLDITVLVDSWGTGTSHSFFKTLISAGGKVRHFEKIRFSLKTDILTRNHRRDHRKIIVIDDKICYLGSSNITDYNLSWRESMLRIEDLKLAKIFTTTFFLMFNAHSSKNVDKSELTKTEPFGKKMAILKDVPSMRFKTILQKYISLINEAEETIFIETPYFLPSYTLRKTLIAAAKRGVEVVCILPQKSDVSMVDILRNRYIGPLHKAGIKIFFYTPNNLHAKILLIDQKTFSIGSPNFDYRSFRFQYEIILCGQEPKISTQIEQHIKNTIVDSQPFNYQTWKDRNAIERFFEWLIIPLRHLL